VEQFSKFSFKTVEEINMRPFKIIFKEPEQESQIPLPILSDPFLWIDIDFISEESENYIFELFEFYQNINEKVKY
jgi:hypothetical protein